jgi:hypothetical protein
VALNAKGVFIIDCDFLFVVQEAQSQNMKHMNEQTPRCPFPFFPLEEGQSNASNNGNNRDGDSSSRRAVEVLDAITPSLLLGAREGHLALRGVA